MQIFSLFCDVGRAKIKDVYCAKGSRQNSRNCQPGYHQNIKRFSRRQRIRGYEDIENALHCSTCFWDPYCAWQKGTNENTNGLLRELYPKGMDLSLVDEDELKHNPELMNNRPRKCLGYKTPNEVMNEIDSHTSCCT